MLSIDHPVRQFAVKAITNKWFDRIILVLIVVNSVIMAMADYDHITDEYEPTAKGSWRNAIAEETEIYFVVGFGVSSILFESRYRPLYLFVPLTRCSFAQNSANR